jgi:hypothetical protein
MFPNELKDLEQWVVADRDEKRPLTTGGTFASSSDPFTWDSFVNADTVVNEWGQADYLGFVFNNNGIVGIDIDKGFEDGLMTPLCADIMDACRSYTEVSRSGRGVHIFVKGDLPFSGRNNRNGVEMYKSGRFFIMTGDVLLFDTIIENQGALDYIVEKYFPDTRDEKTGVSRKLYSPEWKAPEKGRVPLRPDYTPLGPGERNDCLTSLAGAMWNTGYTTDQILGELMVVNKRACSPPLPEGELKSIVRSISRYRR